MALLNYTTTIAAGKSAAEVQGILAKLAAHDRGDNRHNKALQWMIKRNRLAAERNLLRQAKQAG